MDSKLQLEFTAIGESKNTGQATLISSESPFIMRFNFETALCDFLTLQRNAKSKAISKVLDTGEKHLFFTLDWRACEEDFPQQININDYDNENETRLPDIDYAYAFIKNYFALSDTNTNMFSLETFCYYLNRREILIPQSGIDFDLSNFSKDLTSKYKDIMLTLNNAEKDFIAMAEELKYLRHHSKKLKRTITYYCNSLMDVLVAIIYEILKCGKIFKKCENCGKWFVPVKTDEKYCSRKSPQYPQHNCKEAVKYIKQLEREKERPVQYLYKKVYNTIYNKGDTKALNGFMNAATEWKEKIKSGEKSTEDYVEWLNGFFVRKMKEGKCNGDNSKAR